MESVALETVVSCPRVTCDRPACPIDLHSLLTQPLHIHPVTNHIPNSHTVTNTPRHAALALCPEPSLLLLSSDSGVLSVQTSLFSRLS